MRVLLLCIAAFAFGADNGSNDLTKALYSDNLSLGITNQQGVFMMDYLAKGEGGGTFLNSKTETSALRFTGIRLLKSNHEPTHTDINDPAFMFNIQINSGNVEFGGSVRNLNIGDWTDAVSEMLSKNRE
ncbi:MAG: hypothetical protein LBS26_07465 [Campylobacteraceae bacterium]|jgi:hypothetical protein|nr:hypothetical protein [Campylobacteraceae bacterium]